MNYNLKFINLFFPYFFLFLINFVSTKPCYSENLFDINLKSEIKKGNLLIGLKRYLGNQKLSSLKNNILKFETKNNLLEIFSANGMQYKSKKTNILFKKVPLKRPISYERLVLGPFASFESAKRKSKILEKAGLKPIITYPKDWELWLPLGTKNALKYNFKRKLVSYENEIIPFLQDDNTYRKLDGPIKLNSDESIKINGVNYGKNFYLKKDSYGSWTLIQRLSIDKYLNGVLPYEIGANSPLEALKAQAVIARTWALYNSDRFNADKYHLCITTQCQVYKPTTMKNTKIEKAINNTKDLILVFENKTINAFYHGSNGGVSAEASESWKIDGYPYLRSKIDWFDKNSNNYLSMLDKENLTGFLNQDKSKFFGSDHYLFRWQKKISHQEILNLLNKNYLINNSKRISDFKVLKRGTSGRVTSLEILMTSPSGSIILLKDDIRRYLKFLPSNLFIIDKINDDFWLFRGGGFGHGVGLSQSGAIEMAKFGLTYEKILEHYYPGTELDNIKNLTE